MSVPTARFLPSTSRMKIPTLGFSTAVTNARDMMLNPTRSARALIVALIVVSRP
jgi:hypothetical protein